MNPRNAPKAADADQVRAELLRRRLAGGRGGRRAGIGRADRGKPLALSAGQEQMWFLSRLEPESHEYLVPLVLELAGPLDAAALRRALDGVVARHEILRTRYAFAGPEPEQLVDPAGPVPFTLTDLDGVDEELRTAEARRLVEQDARVPIDIAEQWPLRIRLIRLADERHVLLAVFHHVACDAWSMGVFAGELSALYRAETTGEPADLAEPEVQYADYAAWLREQTSGSALDPHLGYWRQRLAGLTPLELPTDRQRPAIRSWDGAAVPFHLPPELTAAVRDLALAGDTTVFTVMLAAFQTLLSKYCGSTDIAIGTVASGRVRPELQGLIGYGINSLVLRGCWDGDPAFDRLLEQARLTVVDAYDHQAMPFGRLVDELQPERDLSRTPLFQVAFTMHESRTSAYSLPGIEVKTFEATNRIARFDLTLQVEEGADGSLQGHLEYVSALFDRATVERMARHLVRLLEVVSAHPHTRLSEIELLDASDLAVLIGTGGGPAVGTDPRLVHEVFEQQAAAFPQNVAVVAGGVELTYAELNERANRVAHLLRGLGVDREDLVGVCLDRGPELIPALLGVLKAGAGYLPLDPVNPVDRLSFIAADAGVKVVLTENPHAENVAGFYDGPTVVLDAETGPDGRLARQPSTNPGLDGSADQLIYVIYTSGSTGKPKGVCLSHRSVLRLDTVTQPRFEFTHEDVWTLFHSYAFDFSVWEIWGALLHGGRLVVVPADVTHSPDEFLSLLVEQGVTVLNQTPSAFRALVAAAGDGDERIERLSLRTVVFGGEKLPVSELRPWIDRLGLDRPTLINMYGITETTVHTTYHRVVAADVDPTAGNPVGQPLDDLRIYLLDPWGRPVPIGVVGEIYVAGNGVARGYLGRPELTAQRFIPDPYGPSGTRLYRSGDLARRLADGRLEFFGRADAQVKIRGYRIELGEIEAALAAQPGVRDAVVLVREDAAAGLGPELVAYVVPQGAEEGPELPSANELRTELGRTLPSYMVPAAFVVLDGLPLTPNGKLDRRALPAPGGESRGSGRAHVAARTTVEQQIAEVWADVLGLAQVSIEDGFFELGGDSIRAVALVGSLKLAGFDVAVRDVFEYRTVAQLAELLTGRTAPAVVPAPVRRFALISLEDRILLPDTVTDAYPLSKVQTGMVMEMVADGGDNLYHNVTSFRIRDEQPYRHELLVEAAAIVTARHEVLRTSIDLTTYSVPMQLVHEAATMPTGTQVLRGLDDAAIERELRAYTARERAHVFDLAVPALLRLYGHDTGDGGWWLSVTECHPVLEGWSQHSLLMEILDTYRRLRDGLDVPEHAAAASGVRYADFIAAELESLADEGDRGYWRGIVDDRAPLVFPLGWGDPAAAADPTVAPERYQVPVPIQHLESRLRALATRAHASFKSVMLAAHLKVMSQLTHETAFHTGLVCDARPELLGADRVYGMYLNTVPFAHDAAGSSTWRELVGQVFAREVELWPHRRFPLPEIQRLAGGRQLLDVYFNYQDFRQIDTELVDYLASIDDSPTEFPLTVSSRSGYVILTASSRYISQSNVQRLASMYRLVLEAMAADADGDARALYLPAGEGSDVWNDTATEIAAQTVPESFAVQVAAGRDVVAVGGGGESLTYGELDEFSGRVAHVLRARGVAAGDVVGVFVERSPWLVGVLLGIWRAGAAYVPLERSHPVERLAGTLADAGARVLISSDQVGWFDGDVVVLGSDELASASSAAPWPAVDRDAAAYVLYTSGSTGRPKGVVIPHGALGNLLTGIRRVLGTPTGEEVWLASTSVSFDISGLELFLPLVDGQLLIVAGDEQRDAVSLLQLIAECEVTHVQATPSGWKLLLEAGFSKAEGVTGLVGGEALPVELAGRLRASMSRLVNVYGPTETTIWSSTWEVPPKTDAVSIGAPIDNTEFYIVDGWLQQVAVGVVGELGIAGDGVARGYLGRPDLTAERFVPNPFTPGGRLYRTGDLARRLPDGEIEFLGRTDHQVKIRGYRIELGEIESALNAHASVRDSAVIARTEENGDAWLVAYLIPESGDVHAVGLREYLRGVLPEYMVPGAFVHIEAWPLNAAGKLDRKALPAPERTSAAAAPFVAPRTDAEARIAAAWGRALGVSRVSADDSFFDLGGDSIRAIVLVGEVRAAGFQVAVKDVFAHRTVAALAAYLTGDGQPAERQPVPEDVFTAPFALISDEDVAGLASAGVADAYPISQVQLGMLVEMALGGEDRPTYHNVDAFRVRDERPFDAAAFQQAATELVARHEILRTGFHPTGYSVPLQLVYAAAEIPVTVTDITHLSEAQQDAAVQAGLERARTTPFDMARPPLIRFDAHLRSETDWQLVFTHAHAILEGWSYHSLMAEVLALYQQIRDAGEAAAQIPTNTARYADFIAAELESLQDSADRDYWRAIVDGHAVFTLPTGWGDGPGADIRGYRASVAIHDLEARLRALATETDTSLKSVLVAAHFKVMSQLTHETAFVSGMVFDARPELAGAERVYGMHLNTVPFAFDAAGSATWRELVGQVFTREVELWPHRRFPVPEIQRLAGGRRLLDVYFNYQDFSQVDTEVIDFVGELDETPTEFPLTVSTRGGHLVLAASSRYVSRHNVERLASMYRLVLESMAADADGDARALYLPAGEGSEVWNDTSTEVAALTVPQSFAARLAEAGDAVAVSGGGESLTYGELDEISGRVAQVLRARGVAAGDVVGVFVERSPWLVGVLLGVWRAGAAYVPLDRSHPVERLAVTLQDARVRTLVACDAVEWFDGDVVLLGSDELASASSAAPWPVIDRDAAAYVLYTSGSTGRPKGVVIPHGALGNLLTAIRRVLGAPSDDEVWLASTSVSFDISGLELFLPLVDGRRVVVAADDERDAVSLLRLIAEHDVTHVQATPSGWKLLLEAGFSNADVTGLVGGEALPVELAGRLRGSISRLVNVYGPTETTIWSSTWEVPEHTDSISIGEPIDNTEFYITDTWLQPVAVGVVGELCIAGDGVARGYLGRPDLTAERFVPNPFASGGRLYRTGDLARRRPDGEIEFLGRTDHQVKIRGYRIELGEIESALNSHPDVRDSTVLARTEENGDTWLVAYVISDTAVDLRDFLRGMLPEYMVPGAFVQIDAWPLNAAGKLDRKALPSPERAVAAPYVAPRTDVEARIAEAWARALNVSRVSVEDSFFDLGGDSIRAIALVGALKVHGYDVTVGAIFKYQTVAELAEFLAPAPAQDAPDAPDAAEALASALRVAGFDIAPADVLQQASMADLLAMLNTAKA